MKRVVPLAANSVCGNLALVERFAPGVHHAAASWRCRCRCGASVVVPEPRLRNQHTRSCGCLLKAMNAARVANRFSNTPMYSIWRNIKTRCLNPNHPLFHYYGARGIGMCAEWRDDFHKFAADMGQRPSRRHTVERIDNNGPYAPDNCRWATPREQGRNKRNNVVLTMNGVSRVLTDWSKATGINTATLRQRIGNGWTTERALTTPTRKGNYRRAS